MSARSIARRVALAVGDTAGHVAPALALAEEFRKRDPQTRVAFMGTEDSIAAGMLARDAVPFVVVPGAPLRRAGVSGAVRAVVETGRAIGVARAALRQHETQIVVGFGGFASGGVLLAARSLGLVTAVHEANVEPGLANSWLRAIVDGVFVAHSASSLHGTSVGMPVRAAVTALRGLEREGPSGTLRVLVTTGSRGARFLMDLMPDVLDDVLRCGIRVEVIHQTGEHDPTWLAQRYAGLGVAASLARVVDDMPGAYRWAHVAVARAGASTLAELATVGLPAAVVPLADAAADHQTANARQWSDGGAGPMVQESSPAGASALAAWLTAMATHDEVWRAASTCARALVRADAAACLVDGCDALSRGAT